MPAATVTILSMFQGEYHIPKAELKRMAGDSLLIIDSQNPESLKLYRNMDAILFATEKELRDSGTTVSCFKNAFIKNGPVGSMVDAYFLPALNQNPVDTIGSGDAYLAAASIMLGYSRGMYHTAAIIGSIAAAIQCTKFGNGTVTREEIDEVLNGVIELQRI
jgi:sugar/nucleoside kinase (ribokinase family)